MSALCHSASPSYLFQTQLGKKTGFSQAFSMAALHTCMCIFLSSFHPVASPQTLEYDSLKSFLRIKIYLKCHLLHKAFPSSSSQNNLSPHLNLQSTLNFCVYLFAASWQFAPFSLIMCKYHIIFYHRSPHIIVTLNYT